MKTFELKVTVTEDDLDELNHVNNVRYVQWLQDVAKGHWQHSATPDMQAQYVWVVLEHHIYYKGEAFLGDQLQLKTYIKKSVGVKSIRVVEIYNLDTDKLLLTSETHWCLIHVDTKRPTRIPEAVKNIFI
ncbi:acyl-CoA thioesterase [Formosa algae]|uniref:Acyl-CoA thioester hydrolase n=1 Tax=Formosa algae TaxID=225843 RepID=A0A9X1C997_9FLAO|nr:thioesterase family protein [Formosa algae]MBP1839793.1 acyl-CoA thioester hydrolase [Formosa algae]MDQ0335392.1 acyl-CoA thioester hydrolase [Formosa algae]OEI79217.1 thioesterase [Formosa algae]PNW28010.1 thioesterase [Formosa algae]